MVILYFKGLLLLINPQKAYSKKEGTVDLFFTLAKAIFFSHLFVSVIVLNSM